MPRIEVITRTLYKFNELTDKAKDKAVDNLHTINVDHDWWDNVYENAKSIGMIIKWFDLHRDEISYYFDLDEIEVANKILANHGKECDAYKAAYQFLEAIKIRSRDIPQTEFHEEMRHAYLSMLHKEYEYLTSKEAIIETILANDYEFTEDGELV